MYLPKSKYTVKQAVWGTFILEGAPLGEFYVGPYIEDYLGNLYAGSDFETAQKRKLLYAREEDKPNVSVGVDCQPTEEDYEQGSYVRYFRQRKTTKVIEEVLEEQAEQEGPWRIVSGTWILTGSLDDREIYGIPYRGVRWRNQQVLNSWEVKIPGISKALDLKPEDYVREINKNP